MKKIYFIVVVLLFSVPVSAEDFSSLTGLHAGGIPFSPLTGQDIVVPVPIGKLPIPNSVNKLHTTSVPGLAKQSQIDLFVKGGARFAFSTPDGEGYIYSFKLGFKKGQYDSYVQTYLTKPVLIVTKLPADHSPEESDYLPSATYDIFNGSEEKFIHNINDDWQLVLTLEHKAVAVRLFNTATGEKEGWFWVEIADLNDEWVKNAERYAVQYDGEILYLVPQELHTWSNSWHSQGFVLSRGTPFYHTTNRPLDYVEVSRYDWSTHNTLFKPVAYSIPLALAFDKLPEGGWDIRDMDSSELVDALDQEADEAEPVR